MRKLEFALETYYDSGSNLRIKKATDVSSKHLMHILSTYKELSEAFDKYPLVKVVTPEYIDKYCLGFNHIGGASLDKLIGKSLTLSQAFDKVFSIVDILSNGSNKLTGAFDFVLSNIFWDKNTEVITIIDYERYSNIPLETLYVKYRIIRDYFARIDNTEYSFFEICKLYNIHGYKMCMYEWQEICFQSSVHQKKHFKILQLKTFFINYGLYLLGRRK